MAAAQAEFARLVVVLEQVFHEATVERDVLGVAVVPEDDDVVLVGRALAEHLVVDAAQERLVHQLLRPDVGGKGHQRHERQLELLARVQREEVHAAFKRDNPPVQQVARRDALAAEVVDDQHAAVGHGLHGRLVEPGGRVVAQLERLERQLAAHHHHGAAAAHPAAVHVDAAVDAGRHVLFGQLFMHDGVEEAHDLALDLEGVRHVQVAVQQLLDGLGDDGLAIAGRPVDEHRVAGVDRGPELVHHAVADDEVREGLAHALARGRVRRLLLVPGPCSACTGPAARARPPRNGCSRGRAAARTRPASVMRYR